MRSEHNKMGDTNVRPGIIIMKIDKILEYFEYKDNDLFILKKWVTHSVIGKRVGKNAIINRVAYKKEDIIWTMLNGNIPEGKVVKFKIKNDYSIDNLYLDDYEYTNGRPKGSGDKKKRMVKNSLSLNDEKFIRDNWGKYSTKELCKKFNISKCTITSIKKEMNLPDKLSISHLIKYKINIDSNVNLCGIYAIITNDGRSYIGSSVNILKRTKDHLRDLKCGLHINKSLQKSWNDSTYFALIEKCDEQDLLSRENFYINNVSKLHNINKSNNHNKEFFSKAYEKINNRIIITKNNCWEYDGPIGTDGYKYIEISRKRISTHRAMFYYKNSDVSQDVIVRHKCNNKICCNPDHLTYGSSRDNSLDVRREEMERFELRYKETGGDIYLLCDEFNITYETARSRKCRMKLAQKYGKAKRRVHMSVKEIDKNTQIPSNQSGRGEPSPHPKGD
jgi:hypothetical protein